MVFPSSLVCSLEGMPSRFNEHDRRGEESARLSREGKLELKSNGRPSLLVLLFNGWPGRSSIARLDEALLRARVRRAGRRPGCPSLLLPSSLVLLLQRVARLVSNVRASTRTALSVNIRSFWCGRWASTRDQRAALSPFCARCASTGDQQPSPWLFPVAVQNSYDGSLEVHKPDWFGEKRPHPGRQCLSLLMMIP